MPFVDAPVTNWPALATADASFDVDVTRIEVVVTCCETFVDALVSNFPATE